MGGKDDGTGETILDDGGIDTESEPDEDTRQEMDEERERRLDPDNRPEAAEVDNTQKDFDVEAGMFTDSDDYDESHKPYAEESADDE